MSPLDKKLLRDVWRMRLHAISVIMVLACGLSVFVMAVGMRESLERTRRQYYAESRMMDLAANVVRAPDRIGAELAAIPGVADVETRVTGLAILDLPGVVEPVSARLVSLPRDGRPRVNALVLAEGRWPDPAHAEEIIVNEAFAEGADLTLGAELRGVLHGRRQRLTVVGIANSPEFIFVSAPGELFPQPERFGVIWMGREALARAYDLDGAFNEAVFRLAPGASPQRLIPAIDEKLRRYGSSGAFGRDRMVSDRFLTEELRQLATMAAFLPTFFLLIAAFLVNVALGRVIATERSNIGLLKAFGYTNVDVGLHYAKSALLLAVVGACLGSLFGVVLGQWMSNVYREYYRFPELTFSASMQTFLLAWLAALAAASAGAFFSVRRAVRMAPAAALTPPPPVTYKYMKSRILDLGEQLDTKSRIIFRRIARFPRRAATTVAGVALAIALLVVARTFPAVMDRMLDVQFNIANRADVTLSFIEPRESAALHDVSRLPGVLEVEPFRADDVIFSFGGHRVQEAIQGLPSQARLSRLLDPAGAVLEPSLDGIILSQSLSKKLGARAGDTVFVEQTRGRRTQALVRVAGIAQPMIGSSAYMEIGALGRLMREPNQVSGANLTLDGAHYEAFNARIKATPVLAGASFLTLAERSTRRNFDEGVGYMNFIYAAFAAVMAGGVAFSAARITLAEQERDLATLRVLGFTRGEVSYVLIGEIMILALLAVPFGLIVGTWLAQWLMDLFQTDMYAFPFVLNPPGYAFATLFTLACVAAAAFLVRGGVDKLDMVGVLKSRD